jgi:methylase of polypeptide subunit release factors
MEIGHDQGDETAALLSQYGLSEVIVEKDISGIARFPLAKS